MKKVKLTLLSLLALGAMSLASCTGAQGEKGDKGDQGEQGPQGEPGENGEDGEDGSLWHTGEGVPSADLGKEGDMYLDTSTNDVYQKEALGWVKKTNIQGDKGEDGEDGEDGRPGSDGSDGKTAWSNTILPSENGYIYSDVGSAVTGSSITFKFVPDDGYYLKSFKLDDSNYEGSSFGTIQDNEVLYTTTMKNNGFVVSAEFAEKPTTAYKDGTLYNASFNILGEVDSYGSAITGTEGNPVVNFDGGDGLSSGSALEISTDVQFNGLDASSVLNSGATYFKLSDKVTESLTVTETLPLEGRSETKLDLNNKKLVIDLSSKTQDGERQTLLEGDQTLEISSGSFEYKSGSDKIYLSNIKPQNGATVTLNDVEFETKNTAFFPVGEDSTVNILNSTVKAESYAVATNASTPSNYGTNIYVSNSTLEADTPICINNPSTAIVEKSTLKADEIGVMVRGGTLVGDGITIEYTRGNKNEYYSSDKWGDGYEIPNAAIFAGNNNTDAYKYPSNVTLTNLKINDVNESTGSEAGALSLQNATEEKALDLYAQGNDKNVVTLNLDTASYNEVKDSMYLSEDNITLIVDDTEIGYSDYEFVDGQLYTDLVHNSDGSLNIEASTPVEGVDFGSGDGVNEALAIDSIEEWSILANVPTVAQGGYKFIVNTDLDFTEVTTNVSIYYFNGQIDFNYNEVKGINDKNDLNCVDNNHFLIWYIIGENNSISNLSFTLEHYLPTHDNNYVSRLFFGVRDGSAEFRNITTNGTVQVADNNFGPFLWGIIGDCGIVKFINCTNNTNVSNTGFASAFIGKIYDVDNIPTTCEGLYFEDCVNNGVIQTTGNYASMLISNPAGFNLLGFDKLHVTGCENKNTISSKNENHNLIVGLNNSVTIDGVNQFLTREDVSITGKEYLTTTAPNSVNITANDGKSLYQALVESNWSLKESTSKVNLSVAGFFTNNKTGDEANWGTTSVTYSFTKDEFAELDALKALKWVGLKTTDDINSLTEINIGSYTIYSSSTGDAYVLNTTVNDEQVYFNSGVTVVLYEYDAEGNLIATNQLNFVSE